jgi:hypothetical protein
MKIVSLCFLLVQVVTLLKTNFALHRKNVTKY